MLAASQKPSDLLSLEAGGLIDECVIGGIEDPAEAAGALQLARIPTGLGYERAVATLALGGLRPNVGRGRTGARDFIFRDADGYTERVRWDLGHLQHLLDALDTTAVGNLSPVASSAEELAEERTGRRVLQSVDATPIVDLGVTAPRAAEADVDIEDWSIA